MISRSWSLRGGYRHDGCEASQAAQIAKTISHISRVHARLDLDPLHTLRWYVLEHSVAGVPAR
jgi:hypothetical protein